MWQFVLVEIMSWQFVFTYHNVKIFFEYVNEFSFRKKIVKTIFMFMFYSSCFNNLWNYLIIFVMTIFFVFIFIHHVLPIYEIIWSKFSWFVFDIHLVRKFYIKIYCLIFILHDNFVSGGKKHSISLDDMKR
jgi:hypothetical protein